MYELKIPDALDPPYVKRVENMDSSVLRPTELARADQAWDEVHAQLYNSAMDSNIENRGP